MPQILQTLIFEFLFGYILEGLVFVLGMYAFNRVKISPVKYFSVSGVLIVIAFLLRMLPISFGIHTLLNVLALFLLGIFILKFPIYRTFLSTLIVTVLLLVTELVNVFLMIAIFGQERFSQMMSDPNSKAVIGLPAVFLFALVIGVLYLVLTRRKGKVVPENGEVSEECGGEDSRKNEPQSR